MDGVRIPALLWCGAVLSTFTGLVLAAPAQAVVPGANGRVFYEGSGEIFSVNPDGTNPTNLTNTPAVSEQRPSVSGDGQRVAFMEYSNGWSIWQMNGNGSSPVQITSDGPSITNFEPGISPDGSKVLFMKQDSTAQDLWMVGINGGAQTDLTNTPFPTTPGTNLHSDECCGEYSPDGTKIVYANGFNSDPLEAESNDIWVMNSNGTAQHGLTGPHDYPIQDIGPSWSPDGTKIAFARTNTGNGSDGLYIIDSDGTNLTPIMNGLSHVSGYDTTWSPDGTKIAYSTGSGIAVVPAAGGAPTPLASGGGQAYPTWAAAAPAAPNTVIDSGPSGTTNDPTPTFTFHSVPAGPSLECRVDSAPFAPCTSPRTLAHLNDGSHTFFVRAQGDSTAAFRTFNVKTAAVGVSGSKLTVTAAPGAKDDFRISRPSGSTIRVADLPAGAFTGSGVHALAGCVRVGDYTANCSAAGVTTIQVTSGDQTDRVLNSTTIRSLLFGGAANDALSGGSANDTINGGPGADALQGMSGNDSIMARDLVDDPIINCDGGGSTPGANDKADLDVLPKDSPVSGCESQTRH
jgi:dipeptidyl aminopeptidase/acylaminoacyl peptidase